MRDHDDAFSRYNTSQQEHCDSDRWRLKRSLQRPRKRQKITKCDDADAEMVCFLDFLSVGLGGECIGDKTGREKLTRRRLLVCYLDTRVVHEDAHCSEVRPIVRHERLRHTPDAC